MRAAALFAVLAVAGCAPQQQAASDLAARGDRELAAAIGGRVAGKPERCINPVNTGGPQLIAPDRLVYRDAGTVWVSRAEGCPFIGRDEIVIAEVYGGQLCRNDRFRTVQRGTRAGIPGPFCRYGDFTPYRRAR
ncbi:MAG TPA: hypothetical protein DEP91_06920 [Sphingomonas bacterium]|jgi:hypothetical protein|uniref:Lipoprotein n=1 Tax=Sphingomonas bacterium TaxID=1895847 RepID=A0A3D0WB99_9SPHN|nr:hypothetical protein [Sphingomonas bacterium]